MQNTMFALSFGFVALIFATQHAFAAPNCAERSVVLTELATKYHETRRALGVAANTAVMEIFAADDSRTWTLTITTPDGTTCLIASGDGYEALTDRLPASGDPA